MGGGATVAVGLRRGMGRGVGQRFGGGLMVLVSVASVGRGSTVGGWWCVNALSHNNICPAGY